jgi:glycosyltransferase involved in cell wall biosynthesis
MKISVVTVVYNNVGQIEDTIKSVLSQTYSDVEYLIIDGGSDDGTIDIIKNYEKKLAYWVTEPDEGIYDAMNKGAKHAEGNVIGFLNSDDIYVNEHILGKVAEIFKEKKVDACFGDLLYFSHKRFQEVNRYWVTGQYKRGAFRRGWVPPHPTFFVRKSILEKWGYFNLDFSISADFELILRLMERYNIQTKYIPEMLVKMRWGGNSTRNFKGVLKGNIEKYRAFKENKITVTPMYFLLNFLYKCKQLRWSKRKKRHEEMA